VVRLGGGDSCELAPQLAQVPGWGQAPDWGYLATAAEASTSFITNQRPFAKANTRRPVTHLAQKSRVQGLPCWFCVCSPCD